jgi:ABC-type branched-subunit amino acid transport system substrate-binding protein
MTKKFGADLKTPNELSEPQYEAFYLYKAAAEKVGSTDAAKVIPALAEVSFNGPRGTVQMNKSRHTPLSMRLGQVQADGSVKILQTFANVDPGAQCPNLN